ncbi:Thioredoxin-like fold containing protein [Parasponia andersonii]|uniref:Thioredoxin-like fold containing protein n=1 Tax=Parasponia andersonii TaxID=3476 RepID=A0A2P5BVK6_PARAD|nr:Thioredoxin-like fold containing protein [Parasponia andersonii]
MPLKLLEATTKTPLPLLVGALKKLEATSDDVALLRAYVGDRPAWRNPQHPWRVDSKFKLTGVPTLILWENDTISGRLEDYEAHLEHKIDALLAGK